MILIKYFDLSQNIFWDNPAFSFWNDDALCKQFSVKKNELKYLRKLINTEFDPNILDKILEDNPSDFSSLDIKGLKNSKFNNTFSESFRVWLSFQD